MDPRARPYYPRPLAHLSGAELLILDELRFLSNAQAQRSGKGTFYAMPSRAYLAQKVGTSVVTVSRHVSRLAKLGYLTRVQRRPVYGIYQTNLYRLNQLLIEAPRRLIASLQAALHRVSVVIHKPKRNNFKKDRSAASGALSGGASPANAQPRITRPPDPPRNSERAFAELAKLRAILTKPTPHTA